MTINFIPNDPLAQNDISMRVKTPRADRPTNRAGFAYTGMAPEARYGVGTPGFLFWQCREAGLAALEAWERLDSNLSRWAQNRGTINLLQDAGTDLNAYYDRQSLAFFHYTTGNKTTYSGASTDVVAHEAGHALLDCIRPDLWYSYYTEVNAFHEAFGDCIALLTAFNDRQTRQSLIDLSPYLWSENFLEATAEDLSDGVRRSEGSQHPAAAPRHAFNFFNWQLPSTLPESGSPPVLTSEIHSFGRVFSGCFYDLVGTLWNSQPSWSHQALRTAAETAGRLLIAAARSAPETPRFFQAVGRAMILADQQQNGGVNRAAIHEAFAYHNIALGSSAMLAPTAPLSGPAPRLAAKAKGAILSKDTRIDLLKRIGADPGVRMTVQRVNIAGERVAKAIPERAVPLSKLDKRLKGVIALASEPVLIGKSGNRSAILGALPEVNETTDEVESFARTLLAHDCISFEKKRAAARGRHTVPVIRAVRGRKVISTVSAETTRTTHVIRTVRGKKVLTRSRFICPVFRCEHANS